MKGFCASGAWICHTGKVRSVNEDACLFDGIFSGASTSAPIKAALEREQWIIALADGIGGHRAGAYASRQVLAGLEELSDHSPEGVAAILQDTNRKLHEIGAERPELEGTGAAVVGIFAGPEGVYGFNVGDARLYERAGGRLKQITEDDSVEQLLVNEGLMKPQEGIRSSYMHALTQSVGGASHYHPIDPHVYPLTVGSVTRFLLCTDGVTDMLSVREMEAFVVPDLRPAAAVQTLFSAAMEAGGRDNITIAIVDVEVG
jgi:serine/threonine protein phosphatase PrpC